MIYLQNIKTEKIFSPNFNLLGELYYREIIININEFIYCGRPSILENPFSCLNNSLAKFKVNKEEVLSKHKKYLNDLNENTEQIKLIKTIKEKSKNSNICLQCFCKPKDCYLDNIIVKIYRN